MSRVRFLRYLFHDVGRTPEPAPHHPKPATWDNHAITFAWLGHATVLINWQGLWMITDPVFFERIGVRIFPFTFGPKRYIRCALRPDEIPTLDLILLSHAHMDHLDLPSLRRFSRDTPVITAKGTRDLLRRFRHVRELEWQQTTTLDTAKGSITLTAEKLKHWGSRFPWETHRAYNAYIMERNGRRIVFAGDTARTDARRLAHRGPVDLIIFPISAYNPWITNHCTPEEAVEMSDEAGADIILPVHHETFKLSWEPLDEPIRRFRARLKDFPQRQALGEIGQTFVLPRKP